MATWGSIAERVRGKWQIPLFALSLLSLGIAFLAARTTPANTTLEEALRVLDQAIDSGQYAWATEHAGQVIANGEHRPPPELALIHQRYARAAAGKAELTGVGRRRHGADVELNFLAAKELGAQLTPNDYRLLGKAREWQRKHRSAVAAYERSLADGHPPFEAEIRKRIFEISKLYLKRRPQDLLGLVDGYLASLPETDHLPDKLWGIERKVTLLSDIGQSERASTLLGHYKDEFDNSGFADRFAYLEALLLARTGQPDEAERYLRIIRNRVSNESETHMMCGWLLGRVILEGKGNGQFERPAEAISFFDDVMQYHPETEYALASLLGKAEALAVLQRHREAREAYRRVIEELPLFPATTLIDSSSVGASLLTMAELYRHADQLQAAVGYGRMAIELLDDNDVELFSRVSQRVGEILVARSEQLHDEVERLRDSEPARAALLLSAANEHATEAAELFLSIARINTLDNDRAARAAWRAADLISKAGDRMRAAKLFMEFADTWPSNPLVARALLRVGMLRQKRGDLKGAIKAYEECHSRFGRSLDGSRSLIPMAECYRALAQPNKALDTLALVLQDPEIFTPRAPEFADALFITGDIQNEIGQFEESIARLEEWLDRYADVPASDPQWLRVRFLLADSYRRSGLALKSELDQATFTGEREQMRIQAKNRLERARSLYQQLITEYQRQGLLQRNPLEKLYLRQAHLYQADCLFEMRRFVEALKLYEEAAGSYQDSPTALAAFVQIINCHLLLNEPDEARAALARADILVNRIPEQAFQDAVSPETRKDWKDFFEWLGQSELLEASS